MHSFIQGVHAVLPAADLLHSRVQQRAQAGGAADLHCRLKQHLSSVYDMLKFEDDEHVDSIGVHAVLLAAECSSRHLSSLRGARDIPRVTVKDSSALILRNRRVVARYNAATQPAASSAARQAPSSISS
jgi:hypothetical protein